MGTPLATLTVPTAPARRRRLLSNSHKVEITLANVEILEGILYLSPADEAGYETCAWSTPGCRAACLRSAGKMVFKESAAARIWRTRFLFQDRPGFMDQLCEEIAREVRRADRLDVGFAMRPNGTSDLPWERIRDREGLTLMNRFPTVQFHDYTKNAPRAFASIEPGWPSNYHLTLSRSGDNDAECLAFLALGGNVAVVFDTKRGQPLPATWEGFPVIDGDHHDARHLDPPGTVVGLRQKGKASQDQTGFVVRLAA